MRNMKEKTKEEIEDFILRFLCDTPLKPDHPRRKLQKQFTDFMNNNRITKAEILMADLYNNGDCVSFHFENESFIIVCEMDSNKIKSSILLDKKELAFETFEEIDFDWNLLLERINLLTRYSQWQDFTTKEETIKTIKSKLRIS